MTELEKYTMAVAKRKAISRNGITARMNFAIVSQLEESDIPLLLEIIRVQADVIREVGIISEDEPLESTDAESMARLCAAAYLKVEELASGGSKARFGDFVKEIH